MLSAGNKFSALKTQKGKDVYTFIENISQKTHAVNKMGSSFLNTRASCLNLITSLVDETLNFKRIFSKKCRQFMSKKNVRNFKYLCIWL